MKIRSLLAEISLMFFNNHNIHRYKMKKTKDMTEAELIHNCHWFCEEMGLTKDFKAFREEIESKYNYCAYFQEYIDESLCYDIQMIGNGYVKKSALSDYNIDFYDAIEFCKDCNHIFLK